MCISRHLISFNSCVSVCRRTCLFSTPHLSPSLYTTYWSILGSISPVECFAVCQSHFPVLYSRLCSPTHLPLFTASPSVTTQSHQIYIWKTIKCNNKTMKQRKKQKEASKLPIQKCHWFFLLFFPLSLKKILLSRHYFASLLDLLFSSVFFFFKFI